MQGSIYVEWRLARSRRRRPVCGRDRECLSTFGDRCNHFGWDAAVLPSAGAGRRDKRVDWPVVISIVRAFGRRHRGLIGTS